MPELLLAAAVFALTTVGVGLFRILRGPGDAERMMAAQLLGTGGVGALLLFGAAVGEDGAIDVALTLALLAAFAAVAFFRGASGDDAARDRR